MCLKYPKYPRSVSFIEKTSVNSINRSSKYLICSANKLPVNHSGNIYRASGNSEDVLESVSWIALTEALFCSKGSGDDNARLNVRHAHYQTIIWTQVSIDIQNLPQVSSSGWTISGNLLIPKLMTLPTIPSACLKITSCGCSKWYVSRLCGCRHVGLSYTEACT